MTLFQTGKLEAHAIFCLILLSAFKDDNSHHATYATVRAKYPEIHEFISNNMNREISLSTLAKLRKSNPAYFFGADVLKPSQS